MAEPFKHGTLNMQAGHGYAVKLDAAVGVLSITARAECYVCAMAPRANDAAPDAPTVAVIPAPGAVTPFAHLIAGDAVDFGDVARSVAGDGAAVDSMQWILVWAVGAGNLTWSAH